MDQSRRYDPDCRFPAFWSLFESNSEIDVPWYLALLGLREDAGAALDAVKECCQADPSGEQVKELVDEDNWRPHLVAATALLVNTSGDRLTVALWHRIELGSWVVPQLCAVASIIDPGFERHAEELRLKLMDNFQATDDESSRFRYAKAICSLSGLSLPASSLTEDIVDYDADQAGDIARGWRQSAVDALGGRSPIG